MNKSRLQKLNLTAFMLLTACYLAVIIISWIAGKFDTIEAIKGFSLLVGFAIAAFVTVNTRYTARETMLSKSSPSTVIKMMGENKGEVTK